MSNVIITKEKITAIADAIRLKTSTQNEMTLDEMPSLVPYQSKPIKPDIVSPEYFGNIYSNTNINCAAMVSVLPLLTDAVCIDNVYLTTKTITIEEVIE